MIKPAFTPGPWELNEELSRAHMSYDTGTRAITAKADGVTICLTTRGWADVKAAEANAHLIAAAPDMYDALKQAEISVAELCDNQDEGNECWNVLRAVHAALAKAEGRS
jgi:hypothetical protein